MHGDWYWVLGGISDEMTSTTDSLASQKAETHPFWRLKATVDAESEFDQTKSPAHNNLP
jgi:hypothetical protein